jgi:hypothetical protein
MTNGKKTFNWFRAFLILAAVSILGLIGFLVHEVNTSVDPAVAELESEVMGVEAEQASAEMYSMFKDLEPTGRVIICKYKIFATEERSQIIKHGNFSPDTIIDRYHQDFPFETILPGKNPIKTVDLKSVVPPQEPGGQIVAIRELELIKGTCKPYLFEPEQPVRKKDPPAEQK